MRTILNLVTIQLNYMAMQFDNAPFNEDIFMENLFLNLKEKFGIKTVIETGTYHGKTTEWLANNFDRVSTIEVNETFFRTAARRLTKKKHVRMYMGSSSEKLGDMIQAADKPLLIFLDAHWYANPVLKELDHIKQSGEKPVLVIHDFKNPHDPTMGYDIYPEQGIVYDWDWVADKIIDIYGQGGFNKYYNTEATGARRGCLIIEPRK